MFKLGLLIFVLSGFFCLISAEVIQDDDCFSVENEDLNPDDYFKQQIEDRADLHKVLLDETLASPNGRRPHIKELMDITLKQTSFKFYRDQWEAMLKSLWVASYAFGDLNTDDLCVFATIMNTTILFENGKGKSHVFRCMLDEALYLSMRVYYRLIRKTLEDRHCAIDNLPPITLPRCLVPEKCKDGGRRYAFEDIWYEFNENERDLVAKRLDDNNSNETYPLLKVLYNSDNLFDNYVAAVFSVNAVFANWLWKSEYMKSPNVIKKLKTISVLENSLHDIDDDCTCDEISQRLIQKVQDVSIGASPIIEELSNLHAKVQEHGHMKNATGKRRKTHRRSKSTHRLHHRTGRARGHSQEHGNEGSVDV